MDGVSDVSGGGEDVDGEGFDGGSGEFGELAGYGAQNKGNEGFFVKLDSIAMRASLLERWFQKYQHRI